MDKEINSTLPDNPKELPEAPSPATEIPDITPVVKTSEITDGKPDDYSGSLNSLLTKYSKSAIEKNKG